MKFYTSLASTTLLPDIYDNYNPLLVYHYIGLYRNFQSLLMDMFFMISFKCMKDDVRFEVL